MLGLSMAEVALYTGLGEETIQQIVSRKIEVPPLEVAMTLESTLNVPIAVWAGRSEYTPADVSVHGFQLVRAYMQLDDHYKAIVSTVLLHDASATSHPYCVKHSQIPLINRVPAVLHCGHFSQKEENNQIFSEIDIFNGLPCLLKE